MTGMGPTALVCEGSSAVRIGEAIHVLRAIEKTSKSGISTPQPDVDLIDKRLKAVLARHGLSGRR